MDAMENFSSNQFPSPILSAFSVLREPWLGISWFVCGAYQHLPTLRPTSISPIRGIYDHLSEFIRTNFRKRRFVHVIKYMMYLTFSAGLDSLLGK